MAAVTESDVHRLYNRFRRKYFSESHLPDWDEFDFRWFRAKRNSAYVDVAGWSGEVRRLELNQRNAWSMPQITADLLHEMIHMQGAPFLTHGPAFWADVARLHRLGAAREYF